MKKLAKTITAALQVRFAAGEDWAFRSRTALLDVWTGIPGEVASMNISVACSPGKA